MNSYEIMTGVLGEVVLWIFISFWLLVVIVGVARWLWGKD